MLEGNPILGDYPYLRSLGPLEVKSSLEKYFDELEYEEDMPEGSPEEDKGSLSLLDDEQTRKLVSDLRNEVKSLKKKNEESKQKANAAERKALFTANEDTSPVGEGEKCKKLQQEVDRLKNELSKAVAERNFGSGSGLAGIQGITEIDYSELEINEEVGKGGFAMIYKGRWRGTEVAVKKLFDPNVTEAQMEEVRNEILTMATLRHPNITLLMGICRKPPNICIVMEYCKMSLYSLLHLTKTEVPLQTRLKIARDAASAYLFMHASGVVHRDLKSHNILMGENYQVKLCDFGLTRYKSDLNKGSMQYSGTPAYMALEIFQKKGYDEKVDVFAFGTLLWELVARQVPYEGLDPDFIKKKLLEGSILPIPYKCPAEVAGLINDCRSNVPSKRPSFEVILKVLDKVTAHSSSSSTPSS
eukprot:TRINITY_DN4317_c0_g2_i9.p1 TRINITY_DN4317_c0_g2~~TRINITY_DN4317_c0_g2_i9.p1  ORF type:complete len:415 (+),score=155.45 TRINITY_DN4317_c0_g2_i9:191-1435(+)